MSLSSSLSVFQQISLGSSGRAEGVALAPGGMTSQLRTRSSNWVRGKSLSCPHCHSLLARLSLPLASPWICLSLHLSHLLSVFYTHTHTHHGKLRPKQRQRNGMKLTPGQATGNKNCSGLSPRKGRHGRERKKREREAPACPLSSAAT